MSNEARNLYIFEGMDEAEVSYFLIMSETLEVPAGETIIQEGEGSDGNAYFIKNGSVEVLRAEHHKIAELGATSLFGEIALITSEPRTATVRATSPTELVVFKKEDFLLLLQKSPKREEIRRDIMNRIRTNFAMDKEIEK